MSEARRSAGSEPVVVETAEGERRAELSKAFREHHAYVFRTLVRFGLRAPIVDDALQDVFIVAFRRLGDYDRARSIRSWLYGIARRVASEYRRGRAAASKPLAAPLASPELVSVPIDFARLEAADLVEKFLATLDEGKREVFVLAEVEGMTAPEIASALELNVNTVYARMRAVRLLFARRVAAHEGPTPREEVWSS